MAAAVVRRFENGPEAAAHVLGFRWVWRGGLRPLPVVRRREPGARPGTS